MKKSLALLLLIMSSFVARAQNMVFPAIQGFPEDIYPGVGIAVSRFTATTDLIGKGYQLIIL